MGIFERKVFLIQEFCQSLGFHFQPVSQISLSDMLIKKQFIIKM